MVEMVEMVGREMRGQREREERLGPEDCQETNEREDPQGLLEYLVPRGQWGRRVGGQWGRRAVLGPLVCLGLRGNMVHRDQQQEEGQSTLAGGGPPVP